jgi:pimeloyl-ACP methyl ester carboxylesterase
VTAVYTVASRPGPIEADVLAELSPTFTARRRVAGNVTLRYLEGGSGSPVCLLHGRGHAATMWFPLMRELAQKHHVLAIDLPGFGHSSAAPFPRGSHGDPEAGLRFFVEPIETLLGQLHMPQAALVGHSLGGFVALEVALRRALAPNRLVLIDGMGLGPEMSAMARLYYRAGPERLARRAGARVFKRLSPLPDTPLGQRLAGLEHELCAVPGGRQPASDAFDTLYGLRGPAFNRRARVAEVRAPALLLWGERDRALPSPLGIDAAARLPSGRVEMLPLGHSPHLEDPARVAALVTEFLD